MKQLLQSILDLPGMVNQRVMNARLNSEIDSFDSASGFGGHVKTLYQWFSVLVLLSIEWVVINGAMDYFQSDASGLSKIGSAITTLLLIYSAFPIAHIIRKHGESLGDNYNGMVSFFFRDFILTNIRIVGESAAVAGFIGALSLTLGWAIDHDLYMGTSTGILAYIFENVGSVPMDGLAALLGMLQLDMLTEFMRGVMNFSVGGGTHFGGDFLWWREDILTVAGAYIGVMMGLAAMYINLAIYGYLYGLVSTLAGWIQSPHIPIKNK